MRAQALELTLQKHNEKKMRVSKKVTISETFPSIVVCYSSRIVVLNRLIVTLLVLITCACDQFLGASTFLDHGKEIDPQKVLVRHLTLVCGYKIVSILLCIWYLYFTCVPLDATRLFRK